MNKNLFSSLFTHSDNNTPAQDNSALSQHEIEQHLHEQYAINNNANNSTFIAMLTALMVAFTGYAYAIKECIGCETEPKDCTLFLIATLAVLFVLLILHAVAVEIGSSQRSNQLIIDKIRVKTYKSAEEYSKIFSEGYNSFNKKFLNFVQGLYDVLSKQFFWISCVLVMFTNCFYKKQFSNNACELWILCVFPLLMLVHRCGLFYSYKNKYEGYKKSNESKEEASVPKKSLNVCAVIGWICKKISSFFF